MRERSERAPNPRAPVRLPKRQPDSLPGAGRASVASPTSAATSRSNGAREASSGKAEEAARHIDTCNGTGRGRA